MTDQAADIAQFAVRVPVVLIPLLTSAAQLVLTDYTVPAFGLPVWMSHHAGFPLFHPSVSPDQLTLPEDPFYRTDRLPALHPNPATSTEPV